MDSRKFMWIGSSAILLLMVFCITKNFYKLKSQTPNKNEEIINTTENKIKPVLSAVSKNNETLIDTKSEVNLTQQLMDKLIAQRETEQKIKTDPMDTQNIIKTIDEKNISYQQTKIDEPLNDITIEPTQVKTVSSKEYKEPTPIKEPIVKNNNQSKINTTKRKYRVSKRKYKRSKIYKKRAIEIDEIIANETLSFTNSTRLSKKTKHKLNSLIKKMRKNHNSTLQMNLNYQNLKALKMVGKYLVNHGIPRDAIKIVNQRAKKPIIITSSDNYREVELLLVEQRN
jgi:hypothetical protein